MRFETSGGVVIEKRGKPRYASLKFLMGIRLGSGQSDMISTKEASSITHKTTAWLVSARKSPGYGPPYYKLGGRVFYRVPEIMAWLRASRRE